MNNIKLYGFLLGVALLNSCASTKNFSYDGKGFKDAYNSITSAELKENLYVISPGTCQPAISAERRRASPGSRGFLSHRAGR